MKAPLLTLALLAAIPASASVVYRGTFVHYEGAEYESTFVPCGSRKEVWSIEDGPLLEELVAQAAQRPKRELPVYLELEVTPVDRRRHPDAYYTGTAKVVGIVQGRGGDKPCEYPR